MRIKATLLCILGLVFALPALADTVNLSWVAPTQNTDNTALTNLASFRVYRGASAGSLTQLAAVTSATTLTFSDPAGTPGQYYAVTAVNAQGTESDKSAVVCYKCKPKPPSNFKAQ